MSLKKSRKIIAFLTVLVFVIGGNMFFCSAVAKATVFNDIYLGKMISYTMLDECKNTFKKRAKELEAASNIPAEVFQSVVNDDVSNGSNIAKQLLDSDQVNNKTQDLTDRFYKLCVEYLEGNSIKYDEKEITQTAVYAADVYSDCFGLNNSGEYAVVAERIDDSFSKYASVGLLFVVLSVVMFMMLYSKRSKQKQANATAVTALGLSLIVESLLLILFGFQKHIAFSPDFFAHTITVSFNVMYCVLLVVGIVLTLVGVRISYSVLKKAENK